MTVLTDSLYELCNELQDALDHAPAIVGDIRSASSRDEIFSRVRKAGSVIGELESLTGASYWPYPTYADILFSV